MKQKTNLAISFFTVIPFLLIAQEPVKNEANTPVTFTTKEKMKMEVVKAGVSPLTNGFKYNAIAGSKNSTAKEQIKMNTTSVDGSAVANYQRSRKTSALQMNLTPKEKRAMEAMKLVE